MYLMSLVNSSFATKPAPGHVELVDLSVMENEHRHGPLVESLSNGTMNDIHSNGNMNGSIDSNGNMNSIHGNGNMNGSIHGNGKIVPYPPAMTLTPAEHKEVGSQTDVAAGLTLSSTNICKTLSTLSPQSAAGECVGVKDATKDGGDTEVTWAVQVLDKLISLVKQWHPVSKKPTFESPPVAALELEHEPSTELQLEPYYPYNNASVSPASDPSEGYDAPLPDGAQELGVHEPFEDAADDNFEYTLPGPQESMPKDPPRADGKFNMADVADRDAWLAAFSDIPELETVFSDCDFSDEDESHPLQPIEEEPETDDGEEDARKSGGSSPLPPEKFREPVLEEFKPEIKQLENRTARADMTPTMKESWSPSPESRTPERVAEHPDVKRLQPIAPNREVTGNEEAGRRPAVAAVAVRLPLPPLLRKTKFELLTKLELLDADSEPLMEERELAYLSPKMTELEFQDEPSFRLWECESPQPLRRRSQSVSKDFQELDTNGSPDFGSLGAESSKAEDGKKSSENGRPFSATEFPIPSLEEIRKEFAQFTSQSLKEFVTSGDAIGFYQKNAAPSVHAGTPDGEDESVLCHEYPSPSSFTHELSPTSPFSDDQADQFLTDRAVSGNVFARFPKPEDQAATFTHCREPPASVLSDPESDEMLHLASDNSGEKEPIQGPSSTSSFLYRDESSDLESLFEGYGAAVAGDGGSSPASPEIATFKPFRKPDADTESGFEQPSFSKFTYTAEAMVETSSDEDPYEPREDVEVLADEFPDLHYFQKAEHWEPWLETEGSALDRTDLEFLFPPEFTYTDEDVASAWDEGAKSAAVHGSERFEDSHSHWLPYVTGQAHGADPATPGFNTPKGGSRRYTIPHMLSQIGKGIEKLAAGGSKRTVNFAPDPPRAASSPNPNLNLKDDDEHISPSVKSWEVEEEGPSIMTSRRRWRHSRGEKPVAGGQSSTSKVRGPSTAASFVPSSGRRRSAGVHAIPCSGRLFSWRAMVFKLSKSRFVNSDDESGGGCGETSFGWSARRDAQQMKRILKGSQKKFANLTVADILKQDFG